MSYAEILSFAVVAALLIASPGPNGVLIAKTVPTSGKAAGFANIGGFVAAFYLHGALSVFGISQILVRSAEAFFIFKMLGAAYLCWIGIRALISAWKGDGGAARTVEARPRARPKRLVGAFAEGFLTNALNPKVSMFYLAAFPQFIPHDGGAQAAASAAFLLVCVHALLNMLWFGAIVLLFARIAQAPVSPRLRRWLKGATGAVFVGFGVKLATMRAAA